MLIGRIVLVVAGVMCGVIGLWGVGMPASLAPKLGFDQPGGAGLTEIRATFGGLQIAIGILLCLAACRPEATVWGLLALAILFCGYGLGRLVGILVDGIAERFTLYYFMVEILTGLVALVLFLILKGKASA